MVTFKALEHTDHKYSVEMVTKLFRGLDQFSEEFKPIYVKNQNRPVEGSIALIEFNDPVYGKIARHTYSLGLLSMECTGDHLLAFARLSKPPVPTVSPGTCVRGLVEAAALGSWFLDSKINAKDRGARSQAWRYEGLMQQKKLGHPGSMERSSRRIEQIEAESVSMGFSLLQDRKGKRSGICVQMPTATALAGSLLGSENPYRLLSAISHCHPWALQQVAFRKIENPNPNEDEKFALEKFAHPKWFLYLGKLGWECTVKLADSLWRLSGWDIQELHALIERTCWQSGLNTSIDFWLRKSER